MADQGQEANIKHEWSRHCPALWDFWAETGVEPLTPVWSFITCHRSRGAWVIYFDDDLMAKAGVAMSRANQEAWLGERLKHIEALAGRVTGMAFGGSVEDTVLTIWAKVATRL